MKKLIYIIALILPLFLKAQTKKDTLFIKYDFELLFKIQNPVTKEFKYLIKDSHIESGGIYFLEKKIYINNKKKMKIHCLKDIIKKANAFSKEDMNDILDFNLYLYFGKLGYKKYFLVKKNEQIEVNVVYAIE
ncbi:hypothetical protein [Tenacibaculum soleae]|uniref:hypothetical protein n=1 Tax=Tenacibaculum soleae TaxID=447689 RepID=UPI002300571F|nr:hypothetical protein [Tenacibaculum soleae]